MPNTAGHTIGAGGVAQLSPNECNRLYHVILELILQPEPKCESLVRYPRDIEWYGSARVSPSTPWPTVEPATCTLLPWYVRQAAQQYTATLNWSKKEAMEKPLSEQNCGAHGDRPFRLAPAMPNPMPV